MQRRTRIVATLGPATDRPGVLERMVAEGLDVARINFSHGAAQEHRDRIKHLRQAADSAGRPVAILGDLPGPKLRAVLPQALELKPGTPVTLALRGGAVADLQLTEPEAVASLRVGQRVLLDDGRLQARVAGIQGERATLDVLVGGTLAPGKGVNLPDTDLHVPAITRRDREAVAVAMEAGVDWLALSFVRDASAAHELRGVVRGYERNTPIIAKIERPEAVRRSAEIIEAFDGIMVARGDLGVEIALEKVPHVQKRLIQESRAAGKPVVTATDMLDSMRHAPRPTRAEVSDVANAVYDGSDAVMLSGETAVGDYPAEALACMDHIIRETEQHCIDEEDTHLLPAAHGELTDHITHMLCSLALEINAEAIITPTLTGRTARLVARHRPKPAIIATSSSAAVVRQLALVWGVQGVRMPLDQAGDDRVTTAVRASFRGGAVREGALVVVFAGHPIEGGPAAPTIRVVRVGSGGAPAEP